MFKEKSAKTEQLSFANVFIGLTPDQVKKLNNSWAGVFYEEIYSKIDESLFKPLYSEVGSRPNVPVRQLVGALILKEYQQCTDEELLENLEWNRQYQLALGLNGFDKLPFSTRTLTRFRTRLYKYEEETGIDLIHEAIKPLLDGLNLKMKTKKNYRRMDSFQISSNIKNLTRAEILFETNRVCLKALEKAGIVIPGELAHYLTPFEHNQVFYYDKKDYDQKMKQLIQDVFSVRDLFKESGCGLEEAGLIERLISEQLINEDGTYRLKTGKNEGLHSKTLQSPHDPGATYRKKKKDYTGYVGNVEEAACEDGSMITDYQYEQNSYSDSRFMKDFIQKEAGSSQEGITLVTDGAYGSVENERLAEAGGINHVPTELIGRKTADICADFIFNEDGTEILKCPSGLSPIKCSYMPSSGQARAVFDLSCCEQCPYYNTCRPKLQKKTAVKQLSFKSVMRARAKRKQTGDTFNQCRNFRNGAEAVPSIMRRKFKVDGMPVRGLIRTRHLFGFKIAGLAMTKFMSFRKRKSKRKSKCA